MYVYGDREELTTLSTEGGCAQAASKPRRHLGGGAIAAAIGVMVLLVGVAACAGDKVVDAITEAATTLEQIDATEADAAPTASDVITVDDWRISTIGSTPLTVSYYATINDIVWLRLELSDSYELGYLYYQAASVDVYHDGSAVTSSTILTFDDADRTVLVGIDGAGAFTFQLLTARVNESGSVAWHTWDATTLLVEEV